MEEKDLLFDKKLGERKKLYYQNSIDITKIILDDASYRNNYVRLSPVSCLCHRIFRFYNEQNKAFLFQNRAKTCVNLFLL